jgi:diaminohydroxyphosphoribosylaminopyrimidine deaminase/5-amino-6-(5-phosphoribosylamino)uracil reductase
MEPHLARALELARRGAGTTAPNPSVGAVVVRGGEVVGEGSTEPAGDRHGEIVALDAAGEQALGATLYVTMEPCTHHGRTPPCVDRVLEAGVAKVVAGSLDPNPEACGGFERLRAAGIEVELFDSSDARRQNEAWRTWVALRRPFVTYKVAVTLDGRVSVPGARWVSGEESRRLVHVLRAASDAVAVGMGTVRADAPSLTARDVGEARQPRRLAFGRGPLPEGSELELRSGAPADELAALAEEGVQSLLLEGGPTLATAFLDADLVDKLLVFVAPILGGSGPSFVGDLGDSRRLARVEASRGGDDTVHRADDRIVTLLSQWLARHVSDDELRRRIEAIGTDELSATQAEAVQELLAELGGDRGQNEMLVRETLEALALG